MELKKSVAAEVPVLLSVAATGAMVTGVTAPVVYIRKAGGAEAAKAVVNGVSWTEAGAHFPGVYSLSLSAADTDTVGPVLISVQGGTSDVNVSAHYVDDYEQQNHALLQSISTLEQSMSTTLTAVNSSVTSLASAVAAVDSAVSSIDTAVDTINTATASSNTLDTSNQVLLQTVKGVVETLQKLALNHTKIDPVAKTFTVYADNGTTPLYVFNLKDAEGNPSITNIAERVPAT